MSETPASTDPTSARMQRLSLTFRLILSSLLLAILGLVVAGLILINLYRESVQSAFDAQLETYANALIGDLAAQRALGAEIVLLAPENIAEPRFLEPLSGWYWQVARLMRGTSEPDVLFTSDSLIGSDLGFLTDSGTNAVQSQNSSGPGGAAIRQLQRSFLLPGDEPLLVTVTGNLTELNDDIADFRSSLIITFLTFAAFLALAIFVQVRIGLRPLENIRGALREVQAGQADRISGSYPGEIAPVVEEINGLIAANKGVVERARTQVGNLAHGLKTPLSVIANEASAKQVDGNKLAEQVRLMRGQIDHYLARARTAAGLVAVGTVTPVAPVAESLIRAMNKIYRDRDLTITADIPVDLQFRGEKQDLEELIGNLIDNACKWASSEVSVTAEILSPRKISLTIRDDGPGLTDAECKKALQRGQRLDETVQGSGLGLSIIQETIGLYEGELFLRRAGLGGLEAELHLPGALKERSKKQ